MKRALFAFIFVATISPAFADDASAPPAKPPTIEELQRQIVILRTALSAVTQQRNALHAAADDAVVQAYVDSTVAKPATSPTK